MASKERIAFYKSKLWNQVKNSVWLKQYCLCAYCNRPVYVDGISEWIPKEQRLKGIVHHIEHLHSNNLDDDSIAIDENNLIGLCIDCHNEIHHLDKANRNNYSFDENGNLVPKEVKGGCKAHIV